MGVQAVSESEPMSRGEVQELALGVLSARAANPNSAKGCTVNVIGDELANVWGLDITPPDLQDVLAGMVPDRVARDGRLWRLATEDDRVQYHTRQVYDAMRDAEHAPLSAPVRALERARDHLDALIALRGGAA